MFGFTDRLVDWIRKAAVDQLDPEGAPLHPPAVYVSGGEGCVVPKVDTPPVDTSPWIGFAQLEQVGVDRVNVVGWNDDALSDSLSAPAAVAILLDKPFPWEFPRKIQDVLDELERAGVSTRLVLALLRMGVLINPSDDSPLYVLLGTPMRGIRGQQPKQHLTAWRIPAWICRGLRTSLPNEGDSERMLELRQELADLILEWAQKAEIHWCRILEARPEVTVRRDASTPIEIFRDRTVLIWGCGALGAHVAIHLARAGVKKLILIDNEMVRPGILVRQPYSDGDIGKAKVNALASYLRSIRPEPAFEIDARILNLVSYLTPGNDWAEGADVLIDCTAALTVQAKFELVRKGRAERRIPVISMMVSRSCERAVVVVGTETYTGGPADIYRKAKIEACKSPWMKRYVQEFYPSDHQTGLFQPEPGCSDPTFVGSSADVAALAASLLNIAASDLKSGAAPATAHFITQFHSVRVEEDERPEVSFRWDPDFVHADSHKGYELRITPGAWGQMLAWMSQRERLDGPEVETGGLLFGKREDTLRTIWVTEVIGPPPDSSASSGHFLCGVIGVVEAHEQRKRLTRGEVQYVGSWHTHPCGLPLPSRTDVGAMAQILAEGALPPRSHLMLIVGGQNDNPLLGGFVFERSDFSAEVNFIQMSAAVRLVASPTRQGHRIGLALSGGGFRAVAFHLGCLRALHDRGVLQNVEVVSTVSGGSVIGSMFAYSSESFPEFEQRVVEMLHSGLQWEMLKELLFTDLMASVLFTNLISRPLAAAARLLKIGMRPSRWASRTDALERALDKKFFHGKRLSAVERNGLAVVINACELRTGTAFRFGNERSGSWRYGTIQPNDVTVARAVAASAAFPLLLPALDCSFDFKKKEKVQRQSVLLTDGGVYDNLGVSCLEPGRSSEYSTHTYDLDYIVCCNAGNGPFSGEAQPTSFLSRTRQVSAAIMRKTQDAAMQRMHHFAASGRIKGFVLAYLGQDDRKLPYTVPDLVARDTVHGYPTDFKAMTPESIDRISLRGEQLTRALLDYYCPEL
jgi:predicted acylesterase/phospholipase RssA/predicted ThiF/HesA family dinucleotide-utilizing enzyme/proteasome lid subunit RPN8/RPN11